MREVGSLVLVVLAFSTLALAEQSIASEGDPVPVTISKDPTYGISEKNPIKVGRAHGGPRDEDLYFDSVRGPKGERLHVKRVGSCCEFKTPNGWVSGVGLLDKFEVNYKGLEKPAVLYLDIYDYEKPLVPVGFTKGQ